MVRTPRSCSLVYFPLMYVQKSYQTSLIPLQNGGLHTRLPFFEIKGSLTQLSKYWKRKMCRIVFLRKKRGKEPPFGKIVKGGRDERNRI